MLLINLFPHKIRLHNAMKQYLSGKISPHIFQHYSTLLLAALWRYVLLPVYIITTHYNVTYEY